jgi:hypothetical protein
MLSYFLHIIGMGICKKDKWFKKIAMAYSQTDNEASQAMTITQLKLQTSSTMAHAQILN